MGPFVHCLLLKCSLIIFLMFPDSSLTQSVSSMQPPNCWDFERSALLQLKEGFILNKSASDYEWAYPKVFSWKVDRQAGGDCCSWDGVECDNNTGHVIGLDLTSSFLYGSIDSNSSLFHLFHLTRLSLSDNDFKYSKIPLAIGNLSRLSYLNLSLSAFAGQIPMEVLELSRLKTLDLSLNYLVLQSPSLKSLAEKLVNLEYLNLVEVNLSSNVPQSLANLSSLTYLSLASCGLHGEFPVKVFQLPNLQILEVSSNPYLTGSLPEFPKNSSIEFLSVGFTGFSGELPESIGNLKSLSVLNLGECNFSGPIPSSLANLTHLTYLSLANNGFSRGTLSWLGMQTKLTSLYLYGINSWGSIPSLKNITQLTYLNLFGNQISGQIPPWIGNFTQLILLVLGQNELSGPIPPSLLNLVNLEYLVLADNYLTGTVKLEQFFLHNKGLKNLQLTGNDLSVLAATTKNVTIPKFRMLTLGSCNLFEFPSFLAHQDELVFLDLGGNKIDGHIPKWLWGLSANTLSVLNLNGNFLTGFDEPTVVPPWTNLRYLDLRYNKLQGSLPIPPASIFHYFVKNNSLTGAISPMICNLSSITVLDLSDNNFSGLLPPCLVNLSRSLSILDLHDNGFRGPIPPTCEKGSKLRMIDFSQNQLKGQIPRSMVHCSMLESLNLGNNQINDAFPSQLGTLPELKILILRHNGFHGEIGKPKTNYDFPKLRILDLSFNKFVGHLPSQYFQRWKAMKLVDSSELKYLEADASFQVPGYRWSIPIFYSMTLTNKGVDTEYQKIQEFLVVVDLSSNRFKGSIPEDIQILKGLQLLNLSNNLLFGAITPSLANLRNLESLDLSQNKLSGEIPQELAQLTFLGFLNVSDNQLIGLIPQGKQFATFDNNSFGGNPGLCGKPLSKNCYSETSPPQSWSSKKETEDTLFEFGWKIVALGYGSGGVVGLILGYFSNPWKHKWFVKYFGWNKQQRRRRHRS